MKIFLIFLKENIFKSDHLVAHRAVESLLTDTRDRQRNWKISWLYFPSPPPQPEHSEDLLTARRPITAPRVKMKVRGRKMFNLYQPQYLYSTSPTSLFVVQITIKPALQRK